MNASARSSLFLIENGHALAYVGGSDKSLFFNELWQDSKAIESYEKVIIMEDLDFDINCTRTEFRS